MNTTLLKEALEYADAVSPSYDLTPKERLLLYIMAIEADAGGILSGMTQERMRRLMGSKNRSNVVRALRSLRRKGVVRNLTDKRPFAVPMAYKISFGDES